MDSKELRIGNLVACNWVSGRVKDGILKISPFDFCNEDNLDTLHPIPLTEEWLLRFGFKIIDDEGQNSEGSDRVIYRNGISISLNKGKVHLWIYNDEDSWYSQERWTFQYVHQLQNLYFALTNEELKWIA